VKKRNLNTIIHADNLFQYIYTFDKRAAWLAFFFLLLSIKASIEEFRGGQIVSYFLGNPQHCCCSLVFRSVLLY